MVVGSSPTGRARKIIMTLHLYIVVSFVLLAIGSIVSGYTDPLGNDRIPEQIMMLFALCLMWPLIFGMLLMFLVIGIVLLPFYGLFKLGNYIKEKSHVDN